MRVRTLIAIVAAIVVLGSQMVSARMFPSVLMFYGGALKQPVFAAPRTVTDAEAHVGFWCGRSTGISDKMLKERPYVNIAVFWIPWSRVDTTEKVKALTSTLKPEQANQHGRIYFARDGVGAAAVISALGRSRSAPTATDMGLPAQPVPAQADEYAYGCWLTDAEIETARQAGVSLR